MKNYYLFDLLLHREKTAPIIKSARKLFEILAVDAPSFKEAKGDVGSEYMSLDKLKFLERNAYNLSFAAEAGRDIICIEQSSLISLAHTKELIEADQQLKFEMAQRLEKYNLKLNLNLEVLSLEQFLVDVFGLDKLSSFIKRPFSNFQAALYLGSQACRAKKYHKEATLDAVLKTLSLTCVKHASKYESDGFEVLEASTLLAKKLASHVMLDMFDHAADFILVSDARSFVMFDHYQKELEKLAGRDLRLGILSLPELLVLACGESNKKSIGLDQHTVPVTLI